MLCLGDDEEAIPALTTHFKSVIKAIGEGKWLHYANPTRMGTSVFNFFSKTQMEAKLTLDLQPKSFFLQPRLLAVKLTKIREAVVRSMRKLDYAKVTPEVTNVFGPEAVGVASSGIDDLFPPPRAGRPKKQVLISRLEMKQQVKRRKVLRQEDMKGPSFVPGVSSSSQPHEATRISSILAQAVDSNQERLRLV